MTTVRFPLAADRRGFTLIEVIVTIIISAVLAIILAQVIANQTSRSYMPIQVINENLALRAVMENIAADCRQGASVQVLQSRVTAGDYWNNPAFTFTGNVPMSIVDNGCIVFNALGNEEASPCTNSNILKVTIAAGGTSHRLTSLFAP
ncbi:MAG: prepilin-type N-terminal cleavage/methylation domain-containing protein [Desulfobacterales bacterium]|nr:prepilin-type N-terminal cleavage/methylation domain-containing protein [Desulfobacterales bacterium]